MGSFDEHEKGKSPTLNWVARGIERHNAAVYARAMACPAWRRWAWRFGFTGPYYNWQQSEPLYSYYPTQRKDGE